MNQNETDYLVRKAQTHVIFGNDILVHDIGPLLSQEKVTDDVLLSAHSDIIKFDPDTYNKISLINFLEENFKGFSPEALNAVKRHYLSKSVFVKEMNDKYWRGFYASENNTYENLTDMDIVAIDREGVLHFFEFTIEFPDDVQRIQHRSFQNLIAEELQAYSEQRDSKNRPEFSVTLHKRDWDEDFDIRDFESKLNFSSFQASPDTTMETAFPMRKISEGYHKYFQEKDDAGIPALKNGYALFVADESHEYLMFSKNKKDLQPQIDIVPMLKNRNDVSCASPRTGAFTLMLPKGSIKSPLVDRHPGKVRTGQLIASLTSQVKKSQREQIAFLMSELTEPRIKQLYALRQIKESKIAKFAIPFLNKELINACRQSRSYRPLSLYQNIAKRNASSQRNFIIFCSQFPYLAAAILSKNDYTLDSEIKKPMLEKLFNGEPVIPLISEHFDVNKKTVSWFQGVHCASIPDWKERNVLRNNLQMIDALPKNKRPTKNKGKISLKLQMAALSDRYIAMKKILGHENCHKILKVTTPDWQKGLAGYSEKEDAKIAKLPIKDRYYAMYNLWNNSVQNTEDFIDDLTNKIVRSWYARKSLADNNNEFPAQDILLLSQQNNHIFIPITRKMFAGKNVNTIVKASDTWHHKHREISAAGISEASGSASNWKTALGNPIDFLSDEGRTIRITEVNNSITLKELGLKQDHCVGIYANNIKTGNSHIFVVQEIGLQDDDPVKSLSTDKVLSTIEFRHITKSEKTGNNTTQYEDSYSPHLKVSEDNLAFELVQNFAKSNTMPEGPALEAEEFLEDILNNKQHLLDKNFLEERNQRREHDALELIDEYIGIDYRDKKVCQDVLASFSFILGKNAKTMDFDDFGQKYFSPVLEKMKESKTNTRTTNELWCR